MSWTGYRKATMKDAQFVYDLRFKDKVVVGNSWTSSIPDYDYHTSYFKLHLDEYWIIGNNVGFVRKTDGNISIAIVKKYRNCGIASDVLGDFKGRAEVKIGNDISKKTFEKAGFKLVGWIMEKRK